MATDPRAPDAGDKPFFRVALNLPHAGRIAHRIMRLLPAGAAAEGADAAASRAIAAEMIEILDPSFDLDENPPPKLAAELRDRAAALGRRLVEHIERGGFGHDRLGQCVRNFFECLELGREGADISLRAGENPRSPQRPM